MTNGAKVKIKIDGASLGASMTDGSTGGEAGGSNRSLVGGAHSKSGSEEELDDDRLTCETMSEFSVLDVGPYEVRTLHYPSLGICYVCMIDWVEFNVLSAR